MSIGSPLSSQNAASDSLTRIIALLPTLTYKQLLALKTQIDSAAATIPSKFLDLPCEIRLSIYKSYFSGIDEVIRVQRLDTHDYETEEYEALGLNHCGEILGVCRLIAQEAQPLLRAALATKKVRFCMAGFRVNRFLITSARTTHVPLLSAIRTVQLPLHGLTGLSSKTMDVLEGKNVTVFSPPIITQFNDHHLNGTVLRSDRNLLLKHIGTVLTDEEDYILSQEPYPDYLFSHLTSRLAQAAIAFGYSRCATEILATIVRYGDRSSCYEMVRYALAG